MNCIGNIKEGSISFEDWTLIDNSINEVFKKYLNKQLDYILLEKKVAEAILIELENILNQFIDEILKNDTSFQPSYRYFEYKMKSKDITLLIDRLGGQSKVTNIDLLVMIFRQTLIDENSFYLYYLPKDVHEKYFQVGVKITEGSLDINTISENYIEELLTYKLITIDKNKVYPTHKLHAFYYFTN